MKKLSLTQTDAVRRLFSYTQETLVDSCLQGHHGSVWADDPVHPSCAKIVVGGFCLLAGDYAADGAQALLRAVPEGYTLPYMLLVPENEGWCRLIETSLEHWRQMERYAIKKEGDVFDRARLGAFVKALPGCYELRRIDGALYRRALEQDLFRDFCSNFVSEEDFLARGIGFVALENTEIIGGASSYSVYDGGIEIEIATKKEHRRRGVALACGAKLILACLERGIYPSWDAANMGSVRLAEKLGYHFDHAYPAYALDLRTCIQ